MWLELLPGELAPHFLPTARPATRQPRGFGTLFLDLESETAVFFFISSSFTAPSTVLRHPSIAISLRQGKYLPFFSFLRRLFLILAPPLATSPLLFASPESSVAHGTKLLPNWLLANHPAKVVLEKETRLIKPHCCLLHTRLRPCLYILSRLLPASSFFPFVNSSTRRFVPFLATRV